jgi:hypothetical protein
MAEDRALILVWLIGSNMCFVAVFCFVLILAGCSKSSVTAPLTMQSAVPISVVPSSARGPAQIFTATYQDPKGGSHIAKAALSVMTNNVQPGSKSGWSTNECLIRFDLTQNAIWLAPNMGGTWGYHPVVAGSSSTLSNSQCTVMASGSSARTLGNIAIVSFKVKFAPEFAGEKQLFLQCADISGKWSANYQQPFGSFTVATPPL